jgi:hypothetical protein
MDPTLMVEKRTKERKIFKYKNHRDVPSDGNRQSIDRKKGALARERRANKRNKPRQE